MPLLGAVPVMLSAGERTALKKRVRGAKTAYRDRLRAQIVLAAARGRDNARIAAGLGISVDTVRKWRGRFAARGLDGLRELPRPGRPRRISAADRAAVVALACQLPAATGVPLAHWTGPELAAELAGRGLASPMSASSVLRILAEHPVKPWQYQSWISPRWAAPFSAGRTSSARWPHRQLCAYDGAGLGWSDLVLGRRTAPGGWPKSSMRCWGRRSARRVC